MTKKEEHSKKKDASMNKTAGPGISPQAKRNKIYSRLKSVRSKLQSAGLQCEYKNLELRGKNFVVYFASSSASNGEWAAWMVLRFNPNSQPDSGRKQSGDVDYTDFHTRDIADKETGGFDAGIKRALEAQNPKKEASMNKKLVAKQLIKIANILMAAEIVKGGTYKVNIAIVKKIMGDWPHIQLLQKEIKKGGGKVEVRDVEDGVAQVFAADTNNWIMGTISVPVEALTQA